MELPDPNPAPTNRRRRIVHPRIVRLLPCPFCDSENLTYIPNSDDACQAIYCGGCPCGLEDSSLTEDEIKKAWNRRSLSWELEHSARYILEDANPEKLAEACGLPMGVIVAALENILPNAATHAPGANEKPLK